MVAVAYDSMYDIRCLHCDRVFRIQCDRADLNDWMKGEKSIQNALSYLTAGERELLISGTCGDCFDKMFPLDLDITE
jgi:endogenous inhibitor of DNA gyrase (YacG/DUF329 family)